MKCLITGAAGFIGSHYADYLINKGHEVIVVDSITYAGRIDNVNTEAKLVIADITNEDAMRIVFDQHKPDVLINFAAESHVDRSIVSSADFIKTDVMGSDVLGRLCARDDILMIHISTDEVYGEPPTAGNGLIEFVEEDPMRPNNPYSASKAGAELILKALERTLKLKLIITRSANNVGSRQHPEKFVANACCRVLSGMPIQIFGDGESIRDWMSVQDNVTGIYTCMIKGKPGETYNISSGNYASVNTVAGMIVKCVNNKAEITHVGERKGEDRAYAIKSSKLKKLGWKPTHKLEDTIRSTCVWYGKNRKWWEEAFQKHCNEQKQAKNER